MRRTLTGLLAVAALGLAPVIALAEGEEAPPPAPCQADDGRQLLRQGTTERIFDAPVATAPELAATAAHTGRLLTPFRTATFPFRTDFAPSPAANVSIDLTWPTTPEDFDLYVFDDSTGERIGASDAQNVDDQSTSEHLDLELADCQHITIAVRSWTGRPLEYLELVVRATPTVAEPAQPDIWDRHRLYLDGDPGQASMVHGYNANSAAVPFRGRMRQSRPIGGVPNVHSRLLVGFRDTFQNPLVPHFTIDFPAPRDVVGDVPGVLWLSSATADPSTKVIADLYADGGVVGSVDIPGASITRDPSPVAIRFANVEALDITSLTLQVATEPAVATTGAGNPADAAVHLWYQSVQFQSRITLPHNGCQPGPNEVGGLYPRSVNGDSWETSTCITIGGPGTGS